MRVTLEQGGKLPARSRKVEADLPRRRKVRAAVFERDGNVCLMVALKPGHVCHGTPLTVHHLKKASQGGTYTEDNLVTLCAYANGFVEDYPAEARALGLVR